MADRRAFHAVLRGSRKGDSDGGANVYLTFQLDAGVVDAGMKTQIPLYRLLLERGILIRNCANYTGLGQDFYRIAVKGHPENVQLIEALLDIKKKGEEKRYGKH